MDIPTKRGVSDRRELENKELSDQRERIINVLEKSQLSECNERIIDGGGERAQRAPPFTIGKCIQVGELPT